MLKVAILVRDIVKISLEKGTIKENDDKRSMIYPINILRNSKIT